MRTISHSTVTVALLLGAGMASATPLAAQQRSQPSFSQYPMTIEYDVKVPMRDGVKLSVDIYRPVDGAKHPTVFSLTPYNNLGDNSMTGAWRYVQRGYAYVTADARGRFDSDGESFVPYRADGKDGSDIITWIAKQSWSDTRVATTGGSYGGKNQWMIAKENNPHHVAMMPTVAPADEFHDGARYNGVPKSDLIYTWAMGMDGREAQPRQGWNWAAAMRHLPLATLDSVVGRDVPFWRDWMSHDSLDAYWDVVQLRGHYEKFQIPSFNVSGWWDGQLKGALQGYMNAVRVGKNPADHVMIIGPWPHGVNRTTSWGEFDYGPTAIIALDSIRDAWLDHRMLGKPAPQGANVMYFLQGKNEWRKAASFPVPRTQFTQYFLDSKGRANSLAGDGVLKTGTPGGPSDEFVSDPANPVPTITSRTSGARGGLKTGAADHRTLETRSDVLVYTSEPLAQAVEMTGPVKATIQFSADVPDLDIAMKVLVVSPDGRALNLSEGIARARYRNSYSKPELLEPGKTYSMEVELFPMSYYFPAGHRIRVEVAGSDFPNFGRNLQTGKNNETTTEMRPARIKIHHSPQAPSSVTLPVVPAGTTISWQP